MSESNDNIFKISYVGEDQLYLSNFSKQISELIEGKFNESQIEAFDLSSNRFAKTFKDLWRRNPHVVILDYSSYASSGDTRFNHLLNLTRLLTQHSTFKNTLIIGIHDYLQSDHVINQLLCVGIKLNYIKSGEQDQISNKIMSHFNINEENEFILAYPDYGQNIISRAPMRLSYASSDFLRVETNQQLNINDVFEIKNQGGLEEESIKPIMVNVSAPEQGALYYDYQYAYYLKFCNNDGKDRKMKLSHLKISSVPKWIRVLVLDPKLEFINETMPEIENLPYTIKIESDLNHSKDIIENFKPHITVVQNLSHEEYLDLEQVVSQNSILMWFKAEQEIKLSTGDKLSFDIINSLFRSFEKKNKFKTKGEVFFSRNDSESVVEKDYLLHIIAFNEQKIYFECPDSIEIGSVMKIETPAYGHITIVENVNTDGRLKDHYCADLNYLDEDEIQKIRRYFHYVLTKDARQKRADDIKQLFDKNMEYKKAG